MVLKFQHFLIKEDFEKYVLICRQLNIQDSIEHLRNIWTYLQQQHDGGVTMFESVFERVGPSTGDDEEFLSDTKDALKSAGNSAKGAIVSATSLAVYLFKRNKVLGLLNAERKYFTQILDLEKKKSDLQKNKELDLSKKQIEKLEKAIERLNKSIEQLKGAKDDASVKRRDSLSKKKDTIEDAIEKIKNKAEINKPNLEIDKLEIDIKRYKEDQAGAKEATDLLIGGNSLLQKLAKKNRLQMNLEFNRGVRKFASEAEIAEIDKRIKQLETDEKEEQQELNDAVEDSKDAIPDEELEAATNKIKQGGDDSNTDSEKNDNKDKKQVGNKTNQDKEDKKEAPKKTSDSVVSSEDLAKKREASKQQSNPKKENPKVVRLKADLEKNQKDLDALLKQKSDLEKANTDPVWLQKFDNNIKSKNDEISKLKKEIKSAKSE